MPLVGDHLTASARKTRYKQLKKINFRHRVLSYTKHYLMLNKGLKLDTLQGGRSQHLSFFWIRHRTKILSHVLDTHYTLLDWRAIAYENFYDGLFIYPILRTYSYLHPTEELVGIKLMWFDLMSAPVNERFVIKM